MKIVDLIKYEGDNNTFIWKHEAEDFNTLSQLIVHESQEAILFRNGQALDLFGPGKYTLHTQNIPLLSKIVNIPTDGESPFHCEVYFINKTEQMAINWGVGDINFSDITNNNYVFKIGASGEMSLRICDSRRILTKLVGTESLLNQEMLKKNFKSPIAMHIKSMLPNILKEKKVSIFEVEGDLVNLSENLKEKISKEMLDYGVQLEKFWINTIIKPEKDPVYITLNRQRGEQITLVNQGELDMKSAEYQKNVELIGYSGEVQKQRLDIDTKKYEQIQLGITRQQLEGFEVLKKIAENEGSGSDLRNAAMGIGMGVGVGGAFGSAISDITNGTLMRGLMEPLGMQSAQMVVSEENSDIPGMISLKDENIEKRENEVDSIVVFQEKVKKLEIMRNANMMSEEEFENRKNRLLAQIMGE